MAKAKKKSKKRGSAKIIVKDCDVNRRHVKGKGGKKLSAPEKYCFCRNTKTGQFRLNHTCGMGKPAYPRKRK